MAIVIMAIVIMAIVIMAIVIMAIVIMAICIGIMSPIVTTSKSTGGWESYLLSDLKYC